MVEVVVKFHFSMAHVENFSCQAVEEVEAAQLTTKSTLMFYSFNNNKKHMMHQ